MEKSQNLLEDNGITVQKQEAEERVKVCIKKFMTTISQLRFLLLVLTLCLYKLKHWLLLCRTYIYIECCHLKDYGLVINIFIPNISSPCVRDG